MQLNGVTMKIKHLISAILAAPLIFVAVPALYAVGTVGETAASVADDIITLRLAGTVLSGTSLGNIAVIETGTNGTQGVYREGELIGDVSIKQILVDRIVIQAGEDEKIIKLGHAPQLNDKQPVVNETPAEEISFGPLPPFSRRYDTRFLESGDLEVSLENIDDVVRTVDIEPVTVYGRPAGVKISPIEPGSVFEEMGLKANETIKEVNGVAVSSPEEVADILRQLKAGDDVDIKVKGRRTRVIQVLLD